jgi:hypothetical protein
MDLDCIKIENGVRAILKKEKDLALVRLAY